MQNIALVVTQNDGKVHRVSCNAQDFIAFEQHFDKSIGVLESGRLTYLFWLAHHALVRANIVDADFDSWVGDVASIDVPDDASGDVPALGEVPLTG